MKNQKINKEVTSINPFVRVDFNKISRENYHAVVLGKPGSGMSFGSKKEIIKSK